MPTTQQQNIVKTVVIIIAIMVTFLLLFLNKITTPRYLSDIELKINGLVLVREQSTFAPPSDRWSLIAASAIQQQLLVEFVAGLDNKFKRQTEIVSFNDLEPVMDSAPYPVPEAIGILKPNGELLAYFKAPFDTHKMTLTYASVVAHR